MTKEGVIGFVIGAVTGSLIAYIVTKDICTKKNESDVDDLRRYYRERLHEKPVEAPRSPSETSEDDETTADEDVAQSAVEKAHDIVKKEHYNYSNLSEEDETKLYEDGGDSVVPKKTLIYEITYDEFNADREHDKITITWYDGDLVLADDDDRRMSTEAIGGDDAVVKDSFGKDGVKYIRNDALGVDYEVLFDDENEWHDPDKDL